MDNQEINEQLKDLTKRTSAVENKLSYIFGIGVTCCGLLGAIFSLITYIYIHETSPIKTLQESHIDNVRILTTHTIEIGQCFKEIDDLRSQFFKRR